MAVPLACGAVLIGLLLLAHQRRLFARFSKGVFLGAAATIVTVALIAAAVIGTWGYEAARRLMRAELSVALDSVATIIQKQIDLEIKRATERLAGLSRAAVPALRPGGDLKDLMSSLQAVQDFNEHYLEIDVLDATGRLVASSEDVMARPTPDRIGTAFNLEGRTYVSEPRRSPVYDREVIYISVPVTDPGGRIVGALATVFDIQTGFEEIIQATEFNESGYGVVVSGAGRILAHPDSKRIDEDISGYPAFKEATQRVSGEVVAANAAGEQRRYFFKQIRNPQTIDPKPWVLLTEIDEAEALRPLVQLRDELIAGVAVLVGLSLLVAWSAARGLSRPLDALVEVAHTVESGDLTRHSPVGGRDAIGRLGIALDSMITGLQERDRVKDIFGRFIATQVSEELLKGKIDLGGQAKRVTILFSDIRGFTSMAETMTPEQVVSFLNEYFSEMVEAVLEQGGVLDKFLGDGLMAVFGSIGDQPDHARRAVATALRMKALLAKINGERSVAGKPPVAIGIGIHTADVIVGNIGSRRRLEYTVVGDGVNTASRVQALNKDFHTTILIMGSTYEALGGEFYVTAMPPTAIRGKAKALPIYELVSAAQPAGV